MTTALTILEQLGGNRFLLMTGAKHLLDHGDALSFQVGRNALGVTHVKVTLTPLDTYNVEFLRVWGLKVTKKAQTDDIYAEQLRTVFEKHTGLYTRL